MMPVKRVLIGAGAIHKNIVFKTAERYDIRAYIGMMLP